MNAERYITPELKEHEDKVLSARERALALDGASRARSGVSDVLSPG